MKNLMLLFHPNIQESFAHRQIKDAFKNETALSLRDEYLAYPNGEIDVPYEQELLLQHDRIIFQFPFRWFSTPALMKEWQDRVLTHGFAYGATGDKLKGKRLCISLTTGGPQEAYHSVPNERYQFNIQTLLSPLQQTALFCGMVFEDPIICHGMNINPALGIQASHQAALEKHIAKLHQKLHQTTA